MFKHLLVVLVDLKSNILTVFCYMLETKFGVLSNNLLCWLGSCDAVSCNDFKTQEQDDSPLLQSSRYYQSVKC